MDMLRMVKMVSFVAYYRVSTERQGRSGLGLEAQQNAVRSFLKDGARELLAEYTEVESGRLKGRPQLQAAIAHCRKSKARLVIAKLDRLARNAAFLLTLRDSGVDFIAADMPNADRLTVGILALMAEHERDMISRRTKEALAAARARGVKLGNPTLSQCRALGIEQNKRAARAFATRVQPVIAEIIKQGFKSRRSIAEELNRRVIPTARGGRWGAQTVANVLRYASADV
jgi:DNA invertase Pin-like site-specific DNA recombinase